MAAINFPPTPTLGNEFNDNSGVTWICTSDTINQIEWARKTEIIAGGTWGDITGTLSDQTDLQTELDLKANLISPALTGVPTTPTATIGTNTTQVASTAFVLANGSNTTVIDNLNSTSATDALSANQGKVLNDTKENNFTKNTAFNKNFGFVATTITEGDDSRLSDARTPTAHTHPQSDITNLVTDLSNKAPLASPALTGVPTVPTATIGTDTTQVASTAFVLANAGGNDIVEALTSEFIANGAIGAGSAVSLRSDGEIELVSETYNTSAPATQLIINKYCHGYSSAYNSDTGIYLNVAGYQTTSGTGIQASSFTGTVLSNGALVTLNATDSSSSVLGVAFDSNTGNFLVVWQDNSDRIVMAMGSLIGTTITMGALDIIVSGNASSGVSLVFSPLHNKFICIYADTSLSKTLQAIISFTGLTPVVDNITEFNSSVVGHYDLIYEPLSDRYVFFYFSSSNFRAVAFSFDGTTTTQGSNLIIDSTTNFSRAALYNTAGKLVVEKEDSNAGEVDVFILVISDIALTKGVIVSVDPSIERSTGPTYDPFTGDIGVGFIDSTGVGKLRFITVSNTTITLGSLITLASASTSTAGNGFAFFDVDNSLHNQIYHLSTSGPTFLTYENEFSTNIGGLIGITEEAISDSSTGKVTVNGINNILTSLVIDDLYYVDSDGVITNSPSNIIPSKLLGRATASNKILVQEQFPDQNFIKSDITGITGASTIDNIITLSQADYDAIVTKDPTVLYLVTA